MHIHGTGIVVAVDHNTLCCLLLQLHIATRFIPFHFVPGTVDPDLSALSCQQGIHLDPVAAFPGSAQGTGFDHHIRIRPFVPQRFCVVCGVKLPAVHTVMTGIALLRAGGRHRCGNIFMGIFHPGNRSLIVQHFIAAPGGIASGIIYRHSICTECGIADHRHIPQEIQFLHTCTVGER